MRIEEHSLYVNLKLWSVLNRETNTPKPLIIRGINVEPSEGLRIALLFVQICRRSTQLSGVGFAMPCRIVSLCGVM